MCYANSRFLVAVVLAAAAVAVPALAAPPAANESGNQASARYIQLDSQIQSNNVDSADYSPSNKQVFYEESANAQVQAGVSQSEQGGEEVTAVGATTQRPIGITSIVSSVWDLLVSWVRGFLGVQRHEPPRMARAILGAAAGDKRCWETTACHAGRALRRLRERELVFMAVERMSPPEWKEVVSTMRRAANGDADCFAFNCIA